MMQHAVNNETTMAALAESLGVYFDNSAQTNTGWFVPGDDMAYSSPAEAIAGMVDSMHERLKHKNELLRDQFRASSAHAVEAYVAKEAAQESNRRLDRSRRENSAVLTAWEHALAEFLVPQDRARDGLTLSTIRLAKRCRTAEAQVAVISAMARTWNPRADHISEALNFVERAQEDGRPEHGMVKAFRHLFSKIGR